MFETTALIISLALFFFNYSLNGDLFYPPALFSLIWTVVFAAYIIYTNINTGGVFNVDGRSFFVFISGEILFSAGALFAIDRKKLKDKSICKPAILHQFDKYLYWFLIIMLPLYIFKLMAIVGASSINDTNAFMILRYEFTQEDVDLGIIKYTNYIALFAFAIALYKFHYTGYKPVAWEQKLYKYSYYLIVTIYCVLSTGRTYLLILFCLYIGFKGISGVLKKRHYVFAGLTVFILFGAIALVLKKAGGDDLSFTQTIGSVFDSFTVYFVGGIYAFNSVIKDGFTLDYGENTFRFFVALFHSFGLTAKEPKNLVMPFITTPVMSNVYSLYYIYIKDFWYFGILFNFLWGYLHSWFYYRARKNFTYLFGYGLLLYPLVLSFFQDQYMSLISTWIQMAVLAYIATHFIKYEKITETETQPVKNQPS